MIPCLSCLAAAAVGELQVHDILLLPAFLLLLLRLPLLLLVLLVLVLPLHM
jgi:hypothetical protein